MVDCQLRISRKNIGGTGDRTLAEYIHPTNCTVFYAESWGFTEEDAIRGLSSGFIVVDKIYRL